MRFEVMPLMCWEFNREKKEKKNVCTPLVAGWRVINKYTWYSNKRYWNLIWRKNKNTFLRTTENALAWVWRECVCVKCAFSYSIQLSTIQLSVCEVWNVKSEKAFFKSRQHYLIYRIYVCAHIHDMYFSDTDTWYNYLHTVMCTQPSVERVRLIVHTDSR